MTERRPLLTVESTLYLAVFVLALALRLVYLGAQPLNDVEARQALAVLAWARGGAAPAAGVAANPAYGFVTYLLFIVFGASDATARAGPALFGAGLVLVPALLRDALGRGGAVTASVLLALSPTLLMASRSADGSIIALSAIALAGAAAWRYWRTPAGSSATRWLMVGGAALGLALAAGRAALPGLLALVIGALVVGLAQRAVLAEWRAARQRLWAERAAWLSVAGLSALIVATIALLHVRGLGALGSSWLEGLRGFVPGAGGRPAGLLALFLVAHEPLLLGFGIVGAARAFLALGRATPVQSAPADGAESQPPAARPSSWPVAVVWLALAALVVVIIYSGRQTADLVWVAAALALLAGWAIVDIGRAVWPVSEWPLTAAQVGISLALVVFAGLNVAAYADVTQGGRLALPTTSIQFLGQSLALPSFAQLGVAAVALLLVLIVAYLFAIGWSARAAQLGLAALAVAVLLAATTAAGYGLTWLRAGDPAELWWDQPAHPDVRLLQTSLENVSKFTVGEPHDVEVAVLGAPDSMLGWLLRDYPNATFVDRLGAGIAGPVIITPLAEQDPTLGSAYVGQDFTLRSRWLPPSNLAAWVNWFAYRRTLGAEPDRVLLWVRQDVQQLRSTGG